MSVNESTLISNVSEANVDFTIPILCFPENIEKSPLNLIYCIIYLIGCTVLALIGFYFYWKTKNYQNGHPNDKQTPLRKFGDAENLYGMFSRGQNSQDNANPKLPGS